MWTTGRDWSKYCPQIVFYRSTVQTLDYTERKSYPRTEMLYQSIHQSVSHYFIAQQGITLQCTKLLWILAFLQEKKVLNFQGFFVHLKIIENHSHP